MKIENGNIQFEYLSTFNSSSIDEGNQITCACNCEINELEKFEQMGRKAVISFEKLFT